jgi:L-arabinose isomerase
MASFTSGKEIWFVTGSQHLYGEAAIRQVGENSKQIVNSFANAAAIPVPVVFKPVMTTPDAIYHLCMEANASESCIGIITWMHTFSPAKMWIRGLQLLKKPLAHLHTQFNKELPWNTIDMDFMNLNQAAHGDREFGFICARMRLKRKVIVGYWEDKEVLEKIGIWARAALAWADSQGMRIARFGDNMREVAVTEGDKVEAQMKLGYSVNGYGVGELVRFIDKVSDSEIGALVTTCLDQYIAPSLDESQKNSIKEAVRIEIGLRNFLKDGGFKAFTTTFEDLHGMIQLPGLAVQRLMADGYGFGAEGDWKTAALVRSMKVMGEGLAGGTSFMEDYTYDLSDGDQRVLGAHMLEVCPSIAEGKPSLEVHPLGIGGKAAPARLVFNGSTGPAIVASLIDMGNRFRMVVDDIEVVAHAPMPKLPVARVVWKPCPDFPTAAAAWILAGGAHHSGYSRALTAEHIEDFTEIAGIEFLHINKDTSIPEFKKEIRSNEVYYLIAAGR